MIVHVVARFPFLLRRPILGVLSLCWVGLSGCEAPPSLQRLHAAGRGESGSRMARSGAMEESEKKILLVHSYHQADAWVAQVTRGVRRGLEGSPAQLEQFYMDTQRRSDLAWKQERGLAAVAVVEEWKPDVVVAVDDDAQEYFVKHYLGKDWPQIVYCGVNAHPETYGYPARNVGGVLERPRFRATLDMLRQLRPESRRIAIISDNSPTAAAAHRYMAIQEIPLEVLCWETPHTFEQWKLAVSEVQDRADAIVTYVYHTLGQPGSQENVEPREVMSWTVQQSQIPVLGFFGFAVDDGALCGMVESGVQHGWEAGQMALAVLDGAAAADLPIKTVRDGLSMLNLGTASRLGISVPEHVLEATDIVLDEH